VTIDETLILFKGKYRYRQHIKGKPNSTGLKLYALCDKAGFMWDFWIYQVSYSIFISILLGKTTKNFSNCN